MTFSDAIRTCFAKYFTFSGRAARPEYWWFFLFAFLASVVAAVIDFALFGSSSVTQSDTGTTISAQTSDPIQMAVSVVLFVPHLAVAWRRMHDTGRSGLFALLPILLTIGAGLILFFGLGLADSFASGGSYDILFTRVTLLILIPTLIILLLSPLLVLWWLTRPSQPGTNDYGPNPHEVAP